jgi:hypothetical protein
MLGLILLICASGYLFVGAIGPRWGAGWEYGYGYGNRGMGLGVVVLIIIIVLLLTHNLSLNI